MTITYLLSLIKKNVTIVDIAWGIGFPSIALFTLAYGHTFYLSQIVTTLLVCLWGIRIVAYIFLRTYGKSEDPRYQKFRQEWGNSFWWRSYLQIFMLQGFFMFLIAYEIMVINHTPYNPPILLIIAGCLVWLIGFLFESIGDYQLYTFVKNPENKDKILTKGLWQYTRHPNYFGEVTMWWGIFIIVFTFPGGISAIISPLTITYLILGLSGIPMTEKLFEDNLEFQEYKKRTSAFFPWFKA